MKLKAYGSNLFILLALTATSGCDGSRTEPTSPGAVPAVPIAATVPVRVEGRVIDGESVEPVAGAVVAVHWTMVGAGQRGAVDPSARATADDQGVFGFTANMPADWRTLGLRISRDEFESYESEVDPANLGALELRLLRIHTIRPGESIDMRVFLGAGPSCFIESALCRRVLVELPPGESMDVEVISASPERGVVLFAGPQSSQPYSIDSVRDRLVSVSGGEVWIIPLQIEPTSVHGVFDQPVTLKARRR